MDDNQGMTNTKEASEYFAADAIYTPTDVAEFLNISPKSFRSFMRRQTSVRAGRGNAWKIDGDTAVALVEAYRSNNRVQVTFRFD